MTKIRIVNLILALCLVFGAYGYYHNSDIIKGQKKIGAIYMTMNNSFYVALNQPVEKQVKNHGDVFYTYNPCLNESKQCEQIDQLVAKGIDALIINPVTSYSEHLLNKLREVKEKGIVIVVTDSSLNDETISDCTVVSDNYGAGKQCAQDLMNRQKKAKILLIEHREALSAVDRIRGFLDEISSKQYQIVSRVESSGTTLKAMSEVQRIVDKGVQFDTIMALNDPSALGAMAAIESRNLENIRVYGVDGSPEMKKIIESKKGKIATCAQNPLQMGETTINAVYDLLEGKTIESQIIIPVHMITKDNIDEQTISGW
ncbi:MAG: substrate-binding domain-containing protein [Erysipelotrichaceae bacterium]|nr:substrate-binding domain-containing protein [Erysipelotrichaceae bacterium]